MKNLRAKIIAIPLLTLSASMVAAIFTASTMLVDFGASSNRKHEKEIRKQAHFFMGELAVKYRDKLNQFLDKPFSLVGILANRASDLYSQPAADGFKLDAENTLNKPLENGIFTNGPTQRVNSVYWGGRVVDETISAEHTALSPLDGLLTELQHADPSFTATWMITRSGYGKYAPNIHVAALLPSPSEFDLRNYADDPPYSLVSPAMNPDRAKIFGDLYMDAVGHGLMVSAIAPVYDDNNQFRAAVGIDISLKEMQTEMLHPKSFFPNSNSQLKNQDSFAFLIDKNGKPIAFPTNRLSHVGMPAKGNLVDISLLDSTLASFKTIFQQMANGENGVVELSLDGKTHLLAFQPLPVSGWSLGLAIPEHELFSAFTTSQQEMDQSVNYLLRHMGFIALASVLATLIFTYLFLKKIVLSPLEHLRGASRKFSAGQLDARIPIDTNDEFGELAHEFNLMAEKLQANSTLQEQNKNQLLLNQEHLDHLVRERTKELEKSNHRLIEQGERLRSYASIVASSSDLMSLVGRNYVYLAVNEAYTKHHQRPKEEIEGFTVAQINGEENFRLIKPYLDEALMGKKVNFQQKFQFKGMGESWMDVVYEPYFVDNETVNPETAVGGVVVNIRDITKQIAFQETLRVAQEQAESANQAKSQFLATMSHEIRTPMNAVQGTVELLRRMELPEKAVQMVETINASNKTLLHILNDILDLSKIEDGRLNILNQDFNLLSLIQHLLDISTPLAKKKGLNLSLTFDREVPEHLHGDPERLRQVIWNLIDNAIKFTHHGSITVVVTLLETQAQGYRVALSIQDNGIGLSPDKLETIFDPFVQADSSKSRHHRGSGLGLAISKRLVQLMGGTVTVESVEGYGSTFRLELGFKRARSLTIEKKETVIEAPKQLLSILLVEDEPVSQMVVKALLTEEGYDVKVASSGQEAIEMVASNPVDFILMDLRMPKMDGLETARRIQGLRDPRLDKTKIVAFTGDVMKETIQLCRDAGMVDIIAKPIDIQEVNRTLASLNSSRDP
ncbi:MAG: response regulator [Magnetococcales bacterium]|nr:response regulator [Magnetococcales bacterium]